jgi:multiple antibiotic resistance protein
MPFFLAFIPLFVAIDIIAVIPVFVGLTEDISEADRRSVIRNACFTAAGLAIGFALVGNAVFRLLGVTENDFRIGGGILLLVFAVQDLMVGGKPRREQSIKTIGIVPLGTPIIVGPGVLTTLLLVLQQQHYFWTLTALGANLLLVYAALRSARWILALVGEGISVALAKVASLLLAAIAVMMIRLGIQGILATAR